MASTLRGDRFGTRISSRALAAWLSAQALSAVLVTACSGSTPVNPDGGTSSDGAAPADTAASDAEEEGSEASADAIITDDAVIDHDAVIDASSSDAAPMTDSDGDGDTRCACSYIDSGFPPAPLTGVLSPSCYCEMPWSGFMPRLPCVTYDEAATCRAPFQQPFTIFTYTNCDFITVGQYGGLLIDERHYDAKTHEFVGARRGVDHTVRCGAEMVLEIRTGVLPGLDCQIGERIDPCADDGGRDAEAGGGDADPPEGG